MPARPVCGPGGVFRQQESQYADTVPCCIMVRIMMAFAFRAIKLASKCCVVLLLETFPSLCLRRSRPLKDLFICNFSRYTAAPLSGALFLLSFSTRSSVRSFLPGSARTLAQFCWGLLKMATRNQRRRCIPQQRQECLMKERACLSRCHAKHPGCVQHLDLLREQVLWQVLFLYR